MKRCIRYRAFLRQLQALLPRLPTHHRAMRAFARLGFRAANIPGLGLGHGYATGMVWGTLVWAKRCYQRASRVAKYLGQAMLTRANRYVIYRGKAQGRKISLAWLKTAASRLAARAREPWLLATSLPVTTKLAKQVVRLYRLEHRRRLPGYEKSSAWATYHRCASVERLQVLVFIATLALLVLWLVGTATIQGAHYQFQANSVRDSLGVVRGLANGPGYPHHPHSGGDEDRLVSTP